MDLGVEVSSGRETSELDEVCTSCEEHLKAGECPRSKRKCGHHCNHSWSHDECCWCNADFSGEDEGASDA